MAAVTMKALVWRGPGRIAIEEMAAPVAADDEVLVRVTAAGVCGSDLDGMQGRMANRVPPLVMGHELEGIIEVAEDGRPVGRRVAVNPLVTCHECAACRSGARNRCARRTIIGIERPGALADLVAVPVRNAVALPDGLPTGAGALVEPTAISIHALRLGLDGAAPGSVLVLGAGSLGQLLIQVAVSRGAAPVVATDVMPARLVAAGAFGAVTVNGSDREALAAATPEPGFDLVVDAVGSAGTRQQALDAVRRGGRVVLLGLHSDTWTMPVAEVIRCEIGIQGSLAYADEDFAAAIGELAAGRIAWRPFTLVRPLEDGPAAIERMIRSPGLESKLVMVPSRP